MVVMYLSVRIQTARGWPTSQVLYSKKVAIRIIFLWQPSVQSDAACSFDVGSPIVSSR